MSTKKQPIKPSEIPLPGKLPEMEPPLDPEEPIIPIEDSDIIPEEDPFITAPGEMPAPAEGP